MTLASPVPFSESVETPKEDEAQTIQDLDTTFHKILGETYDGVIPFRYGDDIAKFGVFPVSEVLKSLTRRAIDATDTPSAIRQTVQGEMKPIKGVWKLRVQLCRDLEEQPVEDPTVEWKQEDFPFQAVATICVQSQGSWGQKQVEAVDEGMRFSPWIGLAAHRPLGNIHRARQAPCEHSAEHRARFNRCPIHEPAGAGA